MNLVKIKRDINIKFLAKSICYKESSYISSSLCAPTMALLATLISFFPQIIQTTKCWLADICDLLLSSCGCFLLKCGGTRDQALLPVVNAPWKSCLCRLFTLCGTSAPIRWYVIAWKGLSGAQRESRNEKRNDSRVYRHNNAEYLIFRLAKMGVAPTFKESAVERR